MGLPRAVVGFSSTDIAYYRMMQAWKEREHIDFNFVDCQLAQEVNSENEAYIKKKCRERISRGGTYLMLIGQDTRYKCDYVQWEAEVALEKKCRIIGVNLDGLRYADHKCPQVIRNIGAVFVPYEAKIIEFALRDYKMRGTDDWHYKEEIYARLGL
ncbi:TIR domain-containing protein [Noviherbaspirillum aridicola]|uniref:Thoeris protein ThsB TIR-like domain-containing protein n=1 Tax=Noviherbaspirillum aridicola TaxID=2849687 RepID=A0ABQ4Q9W3_9BURK|nr:TIR domain-containing protein [Noviherbaspirillum aridicola]GIZ54008.1 hypothetical protein NCCP691_40220 [Noviherbaspirillum aridicola]